MSNDEVRARTPADASSPARMPPGSEAKGPTHERLYASASRFAQSGARAFLDDDPAIFFLHSGTALEQLSKAYLASIHPSLIARGDFDSLLHACDQARHATKRMRTIGVRDALDRVGQLIAAVRNLESGLSLLVDVRNGVVHVAELEAQALGTVLVPYLRACDHVLAARAEPGRERFWGDLLEVVDVRLSESAEEAERRAVDLIAAAKLAFKRRFSGLDDDARGVVLSTIEGAYAPVKYEEELLTCPSCARLALVYGSFEVEWEPDWDYEGGESYIVGAYPVVTFTPGHLACRVCGLELDGEEELDAAGIASSWEVEDVSPGDFREPGYEEEWDDHRD